MCLNPIRIHNKRKNFDYRFDKEYLYVPCNHCKECVDSRAFDMEIRLVSDYESTISNGGKVYNYTLTYNDDYLPRYLGIPVLCRRDIQLWKKRLKKALGENADKVHIFYAGEYGHLHDRPHWHILIYSDIALDPRYLYSLVQNTWDIWTTADKPRSYVGLPTPPKNGHYIRRDNPFLAVVNGVDALRYCAKYCFKSYNYSNYIRLRLLEFVHDNFEDYFLVQGKGFDKDSFNKFLETYEFPDDERFAFSLTKDRTLDYLCDYFSHCYRAPNYCGMSQYSKLDDDYRSITSLSDHKDGYLSYPISNYLKNKLFNISCIVSQNPNYYFQLKELKHLCKDDKRLFAKLKNTIKKDVKITQHTKKWLDFNKKVLWDSAQKFEDYYICNQNFNINPSYLPKDFPVFPYVKDYLNYLNSICHCTLRDYYLYSNIYRTPYLCRYTPQMALGILQCRNKFIPNTYLLDIDTLNIVLENYRYVLQHIKNQLRYYDYKEYVRVYNERQRLISSLNDTEPRLLKEMPYHLFINHKKMSKTDVQTYY